MSWLLLVTASTVIFWAVYGTPDSRPDKVSELALIATISGFILAALALLSAAHAINALTERSNLILKSREEERLMFSPIAAASIGRPLTIHNAGAQRIEITSIKAVVQILTERTDSSVGAIPTRGGPLEIFGHLSANDVMSVVLPEVRPDSTTFPAWHLNWTQDDRNIFTLTDGVVLEPDEDVTLPQFWIRTTDVDEAMTLANEKDLELRTEFIVRTDRGSQRLVNIIPIDAPTITSAASEDI